MAVSEIKSGVRIRINNIYVLPPNKNLKISQGILTLVPRNAAKGRNLPVNFFFKSLAEDQKTRAIGVILSGTASDGTEGLEAIKAEGGVAVAQDPKSSRYDGMPASAIASGVVDAVLPPYKIALELVRIAQHPLMTEEPRDQGKEEPKTEQDELTQILILLKSQCRVDFTGYRPSTIRRRILRRVVLNRDESLKEYLNRLRSNPHEVKRLFSDLLIHVTEFFRDSKVFVDLKKKVFPKLIKDRPADSTIRIWVVGCSTGEEVYSIAIALLESLGSRAGRVRIQIFATDVSEPALTKARNGLYPKSISERVSPERLKRFFTKVESGYKINKSVRELCLFSCHDVARDPPFGKMDLVSCRNLLIYFEPALQKRILSVFSYSLQPHGYLLLGRSEGVGSLTTHFVPLNKDAKIFSRKTIPFARHSHFPDFQGAPAPVISVKSSARDSAISADDLEREVAGITQAEYVPPHVVINSNLEIRLNSGDISPFLQIPSGEATLNLLKMAQPEIVADLRMIVRAVRKKNASTSRECHIKRGTKIEAINIRAIPLKGGPSPKERVLIVFEPKPDLSVLRAGHKKSVAKSDYVKSVERKLAESTAYQESLISDFETAQEELISANEELQSTNEEFQSANEELETAKEELQSTNEELNALNDELRAINADSDALSNDLTNLLTSVEIPIVMVDLIGNIRRFTPKAGKMMNLIHGDIGRPLSDIQTTVKLPNLPELISEVIDDISTKELEVQDSGGHWYRLQIRPYKTTENKIDGAVIAFVDINLLKRSLQETKYDLDYAISVANSVRLSLVVIGEDLKIRSANQAFFRNFPGMKGAVETEFFSAFGMPIDSKLRDRLKKDLQSGNEIMDFEVTFDVKGVGRRIFNLNASNIHWVGGEGEALLVSVQDITARRKLESELVLSRSEAERANKTKDAFLSVLSHELRTPLNSILSWAQLMKRSDLVPAKRKRGIEIIERSALTQGQLIEDLLDVTRIQSGKIQLNLVEISPLEPVRAALESVNMLSESKKISIKLDAKIGSETIIADPVRVQQALWNLLTNAIKFSPAGNPILVRVESLAVNGNPVISIKVIDQGKGIKKDFLPRLFERFSQADITSTRVSGGLGLGLSIVRDLLAMQNASITAESAGLGKGATFTIFFPVKSRQSGSKPAEAKKNSVSARANLNGICILLVDDDEASLEALSETLESFGAETICRASASEAIAVLEDREPDIVISDIAMPGEDGYSLIRRIREREPAKGGKIPALALTANATSESSEKALSAGFQSFIAKPFDARFLAHEVARLVNEGLRSP